MLDFITDALATHRITRLVVEDTVFRDQRFAVKQYLNDTQHPKLVELLGCVWCVSAYVAVGIVAARTFCPRRWQPVARALALSDVAGVVATFAP